jgi:signal transduction histidine kinase
MPDDLGNVWCGSSRGVFRVTISDVKRLLSGETGTIKPLRLGRDEGLGIINCQGNYGPGVARSRDGRIWFATRQGVLAVEPRTENRVLPQPLARIEQLRADDIAQPMTRRWVVDASTRKLEIRFSSLCLSAPSRVDTYYRLVGFDSAWAHAKGGSSALYPQLQPGSYRFEIGASFGHLPEEGRTDQMEIVIVPLWWQTLWFRLFIAMTLATVIGGAVRLWSNRRLRQRVKNLEHETAVARVRERIARDIHDEVGASLTRISLLTQDSQDPASHEGENLRRIDETAREVTLALDEIVWAVNPQHDTLEGFVSYLSDFAQKLLSAAHLRCRLQIPASLPVLDLPSEMRHDLFLCCRETLNNVVKHACASEVCIQVSITELTLVITLSDNGRGLHSPPRAAQDDRIRRGHGLPNLQERMRRLGGTCLVDSTEGGGTTVTLTVSLSGNAPRIL